MKLMMAFLFCVAGVSLRAQDTTRLSLLFLGDIMQHDSQISDAWDPVSGRYDYSACFQFMKAYAEPPDLAIGNLEVTLAGKPYRGYPQFSAPDELLTALKDAGLDVLVTANNHCVDRGRAGLERTIVMLDSMDILHTGTFRTPAEKKKTYPLLIEKCGFRLALLNYTYGTNGLPVHAPNIVNMLDTAAMRKDLMAARDLRPDAIIVFTHWGSEYESLPSPLQQRLTEFCFRHGARIVVGAHPHVVQPMEWRKKDNHFVAYSLGNFVSGQRKRYTDGGVMLRLELEKVTFGDSTSLTGIDTAGYVLEWVYRTQDANKDYFVLPAPTVEKQGLGFIPDPESRDAYQTFVDDSRTLFAKHNIDVAELGSAPEYYVTFSATDTLAVRKYLEENSGVQKIDVRYPPEIRIGPLTHPDARHLYRKIRYDLPVENLRIKKE